MIYLASDHAGFELKEVLKKYIKEELGQRVEDMGAFEFDKDDDYPDFIIPAAQKVAENPQKHRAIVLGGSGQGESIAANKVKGVRAVLYYGGSMDILSLARQHNDTNVLSLGARFVTQQEAKDAAKLWLESDFDGGRHARRVDKINALENA
jgi:ribose 5-phosphate isomerase B